ncbi:hypothetical protein F750_6252 [Streptomyces sp. PAMC 26508]|nr:hypothetical protein F750_6252 [Streptomyces sp. PAMC 26508]
MYPGETEYDVRRYLAEAADAARRGPDTGQIAEPYSSS